MCSWYSASTVRSIGFSALSTRDFGLRFSERIGRLTGFALSLVFGLLTYLTNLYFKIKEDKRKAARGE
ncbi:holin [Escherichia coli]|nr:holin [Escherichia coli]